jgi:hypothetical protein
LSVSFLHGGLVPLHLRNDTLPFWILTYINHSTARPPRRSYLGLFRLSKGFKCRHVFALAPQTVVRPSPIGRPARAAQLLERERCGYHAGMISLSDRQLQIVMTAAARLPPEKRGAYLQSIAAHLQVRCGRFTDGDVATAAQIAPDGLIQHIPSVA